MDDFLDVKFNLETRKFTTQEIEEAYDLVNSNQKNGFEFLANPPVPISSAFVIFNSEDTQNENFLLPVFKIYQNDQQSEMRIYICDLLHHIDLELEYIQKIDLKTITVAQQLDILSQKKDILSKMNIVSVFEHPELVSILDPSTGEYKKLHETDMIQGCEITSKNNFGWISLSTRCLPFYSQCQEKDINLFSPEFCNTCKFFHAECAFRKNKAHFLINYQPKKQKSYLKQYLLFLIGTVGVIAAISVFLQLKKQNGKK